jgi:hypothetical protein
MPEDRWCQTCGRVITWRKKWARDWEQVRFCSKACRRSRKTPADQALEDFFRAALRTRRQICISEAPAAVPGASREQVRQAARRLIASGEAVGVQKGRAIDPSRHRGDFSLRRP